MKKIFTIPLICALLAAWNATARPETSAAGAAVTQAATQAAAHGAEKVKNKVQPRVAGLENDSTYMSLLREELQLRSREDSLTKAVAALRSKLREDAQNRNQYTASILGLEGQIFEIRSSIGKIASQTGAIEQEFIIGNLTGGGIQPSTVPGSAQHKAVDATPFLSANPYFSENLPPADYKALREADARELEALRLIEEFGRRYDTLAQIASEYALTDSAAFADSLWTRYEQGKRTLKLLSERVGELETFIADNKAYSYTYLLDLMNETETIGQFNEKSQRAADERSQLEGFTESVEVSAYPIRKRLTLYFEQTLAGMLGLNKALDSLQRAEGAITSMPFDFPPIDLEERLFIDYDSITIHSPSLYTASNPIPQLKVYEKGTIYRIMLGSFTRAQPVSIFRGAYPIGMLRDEGGRYNYYAGGFATQAEAEAALEQMKKVGFRAPKIAMWDWGDYSLPDEEQLSKNRPQANETLFRVDIAGAGDDLPGEVKRAIQQSASGKDIARTNAGFTVGPFATDGEAEKLADHIRGTDASLEITVTAVSGAN